MKLKPQSDQTVQTRCTIHHLDYGYEFNLSEMGELKCPKCIGNVKPQSDKKKKVKLGTVYIHDNGLETWLYPHPNPIAISVVDNMLYINGEAVYERKKFYDGKITDMVINGKKIL